MKEKILFIDSLFPETSFNKVRYYRSMRKERKIRMNELANEQTFTFSKEEGMLVNWSEATMITDL